MTSPEVANVLKKYVTGHPLRWSTRQGVKNRKDFETLQALALKDMKAFRSKFNDMKAKPGEDNYQQAAVRDALAKAGLSRHLTDEYKIEGDETMNEAKQTQEGGPGSGPQFSSATIKKAYGILNDPRYKGGNYSGAAKAIEKLGKGLSDHPDVKNAMKRANESIDEKSTEDKLKKWGPVKQMPPIKLPLKFGKPERVGVKASYESTKYHDTKPGSIQDTVAQMQVNEQKSVTIRVKELSALIETYLAKGGLSHNLSPAIAEKEISGVLPLQAVREFIGTYNRHFLTNYKAEEFVVIDELEG
jgi:hypothetical protein